MCRNENYYIYGLLCLCKFVYYLNAIQFCNETRHFNTYNAQQVHRVNKWERSLFANSFVFANVVYISYECCQNHYHSHSDQQFNTNIILPLSCDTVKIEYLFIFNIYSSRLKKKTTKCVYMNYNKWQICIALIKILRKYWKILNSAWAHLI